MNRATLITLAGLLVGSGLSDCLHASELDDAELRTLARISYENSPSLPDGAAYYEVLNVVYILRESDQETAIDFVQGGMNISRDAAIRFTQLLQSKFESLHAEIIAAQSRAGCVSGIPNAHGDLAFDRLHMIEDLRDNISESSVQVFSSELADEMTAKFYAWIQDQKRNISYVKIDYRKAAASRNVSGDEILAGVCSYLFTVDRRE